MKYVINTLVLVISMAGFTQSVNAGKSLKSELKKEKAAILPVDMVKADLAVMILGSGDPVATRSGRAASSLLIFTDGVPAVIIDTGSGAFKSLAMSGAKLNTVHHFLYTHLHLDHTADMSAMVKTFFFHRLGAGELLPPAINFYGPDSNVPAYDPMSAYVDGHYNAKTGVERYLHGFANAFFAGQSPFVPVGNDLPADTTLSDMTLVLDNHNGLTIKSIPVFHGGTPSVAYRVEYNGKSIVWTGDTNSSTDNIIKLSQNADVLIYDTAILENPTPDFLLMFHTTPSRLGEVAAISQPEKLVLSHLSAITETPKNIKSIKQTIKNAGYNGKIIAARDLQVINVE
ncbi:hypothetical protein MNBD_GAMMA09-2966 [hydrothermal vent metagenome]|uniref:Metallo-beta-lactamase domain-containing protein n=1 Tax=hydrothermal vent metagenome TaxID=652676 RepID=A0A3B0XMS1_9ZZZZ